MNGPGGLTPDDLARDGPADLAACDAATPGPWVLRPRRRLTELRCDFRGIAGQAVLGWTVALAKWLKPPDAAFIALARAALPAWIRRALAAEAELARVAPALAMRRLCGYSLGPVGAPTPGDAAARAARLAGWDGRPCEFCGSFETLTSGGLAVCGGCGRNCAAEPFAPEEMPMATEKQLEKRALKAQEARRRAQERAHKAHALAGDALDAFSVAAAEEEAAFKELCACRPAAAAPPARNGPLPTPEDEE